MNKDKEGKEWKYILLVDGGSYFANSLWGLLTEVFEHRLWHWRKGHGWKD